MRRTRKKKDLSFLTQNQHYKTLHLLLYLVTVLMITFLYFITLLFFSKYVHTIIFAIISLLIGIYIVYHRDKIVKAISEKLENHKRKNYKKTSKSNLKTTLRRITTKNKKLKLNIKGKTSIKEKISNIKIKFKKKDKTKRKTVDYIEIE